MKTLEETIANDEHLASLIEETYSALHRGDAEKMIGDAFAINFNSFDPRTLIEEQEHGIYMIACTNNTMNENYSEGDPIFETLLVPSAPSVMGLDNRLPRGQSQAWVSDIRDNRTAALQRVNDVIQEQGLDVSEYGFTLNYDLEKNTFSVGESQIPAYDEEGNVSTKPSISAEEREMLQKAIESDSQLADIVKSIFQSLRDENMIDETVKSFALEFGSRNVDQEKYVWSTMLESRSEKTGENEFSQSVVLTHWNPIFMKQSATLRLDNQGVTEPPLLSEVQKSTTQENTASNSELVKTATKKQAASQTTPGTTAVTTHYGAKQTSPSSSLAKLSSMLGLGSAGNVSSILEALSSSIKSDSEALQKKLNEKLKAAGLESETKKMTFSVDSKGKVKVAGLTNKIKQKKIEQLLNADPELVEEMKALKAKMELAKGLNSDSNFDFESQKYDTARRQLARDFLKNSNINLSDVTTSVDSNTGEILWNVKGQANELLQEIASDTTIQNEILHALEPKKSSNSGASQELISMHRGAIVDETGEDVDLDAEAARLKGMVLAKLNKFYAENGTPWDQQITDFSLRINSKGSLSVEDVRLATGDDSMKAGAKKLLASFFDDAIRAQAKGVGEAILKDHDAEHGDVAEYAHHIIIGGSKEIYKVLSPDADKAAYEEMLQLGKEISVELGSFFSSSFGLDQTFEIQIDAEGNLSFDMSAFENRLMAGQIERVLNNLNERIASDDPLGDDFSHSLPSGLQGVVEKLVELNEVRQKFHEEPMKNVTLSITITGK